MILWASHLLIFMAASAGCVFLLTMRGPALAVCKALAAAAIATQLAWMVQAGMHSESCVLLYPWGMMALVTIAGIGVSWHVSRLYNTPRLLIGGLHLLALAIIMGRFFLPESDASPFNLSWAIGFHILLFTLGYTVLAVGCVSGILILLRSRILKSSHWAENSEISWPSLTALDRLFIRSLGIGILLISAGTFLGITTVPHLKIEGAWYADTKVLLTSLSFLLYGVVLFMHKRKGFITTSVVGLSTLGFIFIFLGLLVSGFVAKGFHRF